ncbi:unnamed protein product [Spirodela intermedia]|uniref:Uncharacterized protein n=1 Tax=Spirodela intermedia TaxID=51605 RepID=A0A7I8J5P8_SPIIN|nr:unnamed protein product [Spirodela intermedia]CAA6664762.1 unnamed protein product [Spirodela intermedia]
MVSRSYSNLLELASGTDDRRRNHLRHRRRRRQLLRSILLRPARPHHRGRQPTPRARPTGPRRQGWTFSLDEDSLLLQLKDGAPGDDMEFIYVGCLREEIPRASRTRWPDAPGELPLRAGLPPPDLFSRYYHGFCKQQLWPLFHYMLPLSPDLGGRFDRSLWQAYVSVNKIFADKILEVINPDEDFVWVHDYHLLVLPTFLRKRFNRVKLGFFLHSPFPSSEIYRTLPVRDELLRSLLNADLIGFHTFDYARHFLSCCGRMLGLSYESKRGYIGLEYYGRTVSIKILPVGIHLGQLGNVLGLPETEATVSSLIQQFQDQDRTLLLGVDDMDIFKGISLKLLAMEQLLLLHPEWRGRVVLVQIANPARGRGKDVREVQAETDAMVKRINEAFGMPGYHPVDAYYAVAECCLVTAVRDGMNLIPYEYIIARQGSEKLDKLLGGDAPKKSMLVVSEFVGCSPSLSGAIRVNPWNVDAVAEAMISALETAESEKQLRHEKHYRYVSTHDVGYWARSFLQDLQRTCRDHSRRRCWGIGFGLGFRVVALDPNFRKLSMEHIVSAYRRTSVRAILLDYDGTLMPQASIDKSPSAKSIDILNALCRDKNNVVFLVSARSRGTLSEWFSPARSSGWLKREAEWETCVPVADCSWMQIAEPVMKLYTETTDGSTIEDKETSLAKELLDHLESVLANEPVSVKGGQHFVEVKPRGVSKGLVAERLLSTMRERSMVPDLVLCIGDDRSDEDMFEVISTAAADSSLAPTAEVFACTVGRKPSMAKYYLDDTAEIVRLLQGLASVSQQEPNSSLALI